MKSNIINIIIITLILAGAGYWYFFANKGNEPPLTSTIAAGSSQNDFPVSARELQSISFKTEIFDSPKFLALIDITQKVFDEEKGRQDPFAPVPGVSGK